MSYDLQKLFAIAEARADSTVEKWGRHDSAEFSCCRVSEEAGELVAAATSRSKGRDVNRRERMYDEAVDTVAMVIRLLREWPDGRVEGVNPLAEQLDTVTKERVVLRTVLSDMVHLAHQLTAGLHSKTLLVLHYSKRAEKARTVLSGCVCPDCHGLKEIHVTSPNDPGEVIVHPCAKCTAVAAALNKETPCPTTRKS